MAEQPLLPRTVPFHDDELEAVAGGDGTIYAVFARLCENLGLNRVAAQRRIQSHAVLGEGYVALLLETSGGPQRVQCLRADLIPLWLASISARRVKDEVRDKLIRYQREASQVLWQAFHSMIVDELRPSPGTALHDLVQIRDLGYAIARMAEQHMELERQQRMLGGRMDAAARVIRDVQHRLDGFELRLLQVEAGPTPAAILTEDEAADIKERVKALAEQLTSQDRTKNQYQGVFSELYRRFGVTSYKHIRRSQLAEVVAFLDDWRQHTVDPAAR